MTHDQGVAPHWAQKDFPVLFFFVILYILVAVIFTKFVTQLPLSFWILLTKQSGNSDEMTDINLLETA